MQSRWRLNYRGRVLVSVADKAASNAMKSLFWVAADLADADGDVDSAVALRNASAHWLRHTMLTVACDTIRHQIAQQQMRPGNAGAGKDRAALVDQVKDCSDDQGDAKHVRENPS